MPRAKPKYPDLFHCCKCGTEYSSLDRNFRAAKSDVFSGRKNRLPICNKCLESYYNHYLEEYNNDESMALRRICMMFDVYFNEDIVQSSKNGNRGSSRIGNYMSRCNLNPYSGKTYDDTLKEETVKLSIGLSTQEQGQELAKVNDEVINLFGTGFSSNDYLFLEKQYLDWCQRVGAQKKAQEELIKLLCFNQLDLYKARIEGKSTKDIEESYRKNLEAGGWKPTQDTDDSSDGNNVVGLLIKTFENDNPVPDPDPEFKDVDNIGMLIDVFFKGHTAKCLHIPGALSKIYNKFIQKYTVTPPSIDEMDEDDTEMLFNDIFSEKASEELDDE